MNKAKIKILKRELWFIKPNVCPYCDKGIDPIIINTFPYQFYDLYNVIVTLKCPCCEQVFFARFQLDHATIDYMQYDLHPIEVIGGHKRRMDFSQEITELSQGFIDSYNDAFVAEQAGCSHIVGIAYRRAFEFLIKDYAIKYHPSETETIKKMNLSDCVKKYIKDVETKELLLRATWIGNDFAHYENKHAEIDLAGLKELINLSMQEIETDIKKKNYIANIGSAK